MAQAPEYAQWLAEAHGAFLDELSSDEARRRFKKFVARWNAGELSAAYYGGVKSTAQPGGSRTRHVWGFTQKLSEKDQESLDLARDGVDTQTHKAGAAAARLLPGHAAAAVVLGAGAPQRPQQQPGRGPMGPPPVPSAAAGAGPAGPAPRAAPGPAAPPPGSRLAELQAKEQAREAEWKRRLGL